MYRYSMKLLQLQTLKEEFEPFDFIKKDFKIWYSGKELTNSQLKNHSEFHYCQCEFVHDIYLENLDRLYIKSTGYRRFWDNYWDPKFSELYHKYLLVRQQDSDRDLKIIFQIYFDNDRYRFDIIGSKEQLYENDAKGSFYDFLRFKYPFDSEWGHWWNTDYRLVSYKEQERINNLRKWDPWAHLDTPESKWAKEEIKQITDRLDLEYKSNAFWQKWLAPRQPQ